MLLNNKWVNNEIKEEILKFLETNENNEIKEEILKFLETNENEHTIV